MSRSGEGPLGYSCPCQSPPAPVPGPALALGPPAESPLQLAPRLSFIAGEPGASDIVLGELLLRTDSAADTNKPSSRLFDGFTGTEMASSLWDAAPQEAGIHVGALGEWSVTSRGQVAKQTASPTGLSFSGTSFHLSHHLFVCLHLPEFNPGPDALSSLMT
ncbi:unnamed protein product [Pleuronectes platessa]|uniref:Uncharacterized protein n=1 Tax=Pleuronectes platessa TaxID=8262 RepID=A0A9N7YKU8_PLEPL|nr:unnamed protein product [Pleuronectes platessa]